MKKILITGAAGFIGYHLVKKLITEEYEIIGLDSINDYYDIDLKYNRLKELGIYQKGIYKNTLTKSDKFENFSFIKADLEDYDYVVGLLKLQKFTIVINLAAQAGVRNSIENPRAYTKSNIDGFLSILEGARFSGVEHLLYASSSSVYGLNSSMPLDERMKTEHPMSLYAATKKANELMAHSYSHLFKIPTTGLRFFTVYGPWGRPDMALFLFTKAISEGKPLKLYNYGKMIRDFTYVGDVVESISRLLNIIPTENDIWDSRDPDISFSNAPFRLVNIGNSSPVMLEKYVSAIEDELGIKAIFDFLPMQGGDVPETHADNTILNDLVKFRPKTSVEEGVRLFVQWYKNYYKL
jgi:UDP-glucuronate 4-epimerase